MKKQDKKAKATEENDEKWDKIIRKTDESHRQSLEALDKKGDDKWKESKAKESGDTGGEDWQQLDEDEKGKKEERRGGYPKNVYKKGEE